MLLVDVGSASSAEATALSAIKAAALIASNAATDRLVLNFAYIGLSIDDLCTQHSD